MEKYIDACPNLSEFDFRGSLEEYIRGYIT